MDIDEFYQRGEIRRENRLPRYTGWNAFFDIVFTLIGLFLGIVIVTAIVWGVMN